MEQTNDIAAALGEVRQRIAVAATRAGRDPGEISLIAVAKTHPQSAVERALDAGQLVFGENRVQEAMAKYPPLRAAGRKFELHLIGPLQTNKVREAVATFDAIQTIDRPKLAAALAAELPKAGRSLRLFVQVNTGAEPQKAGVLPEAADAFIAECRGTHGLTIEGLMCIPPADEPAAPHFALLREIARRNSLRGLSMGMSGDFELAVALGATHVRVGSAIFGVRG
ncbi:MAG: YggS family pyridoxal phosphate-dependent enzyme [Alphaproteobacteria bacterium]|nr:YggS family pyridoxal phosphate-dependent enzyme [Alphaproteobacteria bacterium]